jgi:2-polyprenyl-3-methyl-5-hydroxy-6-metoxy-1,4-benzoquinol methylase
MIHEEYREDYYNDKHKNWFKHPNINLFNRIYNLIKKRKSKNRLIDIGCGRGDLLKFLNEKDSDICLFGVDLSDQELPNGIKYIKSNIYDLDSNEKYDFVVSLAVIEHVENPRKFLEVIQSNLKADGVVFLMTLNSDSLIYRLGRMLDAIGVKFIFNRLYSCHHLQHYSKKSLKCLVESSGLHVDDQYTHNFPLPAVDFESKGILVDSFLKFGVGILFVLGTIFNAGFLQTVVCKPLFQPKESY